MIIENNMTKIHLQISILLNPFPLNSKFICPNIVSISNFRFNKKFSLFTLINCNNFLFKYQIFHCSNIASTFRAFTWILLARFALLRAKMGKFPFRAKYIAFCPLSQTNQGNAPLLKLNFLKIKFQFKTRFLDNQVITS